MKLTPKQSDFFRAVFDSNGRVRTDNPYTELHFFGGFGAGKTLIAQLVAHMLCATYPGVHAVCIRATYPELKDSVIPKFLTLFPPDQNGYRFNVGDRVCVYKNGSRYDFRAFDKDNKILSNEYDFMVFSQIEEIMEELFLQCLGRNRRRAGGIPKNLIIAEGNPAAGWIKKRLKDNPLPSDVFLVEAKTSDNPFLPDGYESKMRATYPDFWVARYLDGEWSNLDEMVFSEFREKEHVIDPIDVKYIENFQRRNGLDYGWINPTAIVYSYTDYDGIITIYDEWGDKMRTPDEIALHANRHGKILTVADYSIKAPDRDGRSTWDDLLAAGVNLTNSNKQELTNIVLTNALFKQKRLRITRNCVNLLNEIQNYKWKQYKVGDDKNRKETPVQKDNHYIDALLYCLADVEGVRSLDPHRNDHKKTLAYMNAHAGKTKGKLKFS